MKCLYDFMFAWPFCQAVDGSVRFCQAKVMMPLVL